MLRDAKLAAVIEKYRNHPEFLGIDFEDPNQRGAVDDTILHIAARTGAVEDMKVLIDAGANVNAVGDMGHTPLHQAAMRGQVESVRLLLRSGAGPDIKNEYGQTAVDVAALGGHDEVLKALKAHP